MSTQLKDKVAKGFFWTLFEKLCCQLVGFVVGIALARLLTPDDYGTVALTAIFFAIAGVLVDCGFGISLIQKKDADDLDFNSVFYLSLTIAGVMYFIFFVGAPYISSFYRVPELTPIVRVASLCFFFNAINSVQNSELMRKMLFNLSFRISLISVVSSAVVGVTLAVYGFGVWALVCSNIASGFVGAISRWYFIAWRPRWMFSFSRLGPLFSYGWKMSAAALIDRAIGQVNSLLIGKFYTKADLAFVNKGDSLPKMAMELIDSTLSKVTFPAFVQLQNDRHKLRDGMRRVIAVSTYAVFPFMIAIAVCSRSIILLLFGEKWVFATPYMMMACFSYALWPFHTVNIKGIMVLRRSDLFLALGIIKNVVKVIAILVSFRFGLFVFMAVCAFVLGPLSVIINAWPNRMLLGYTLGMQLRDVLPSALVGCVQAGAMYGVDVIFRLIGADYESTHSWFSVLAVLSAQFIIGGFVFLFVSGVFKLKPFLEIKDLVTRFRFRKLNEGVLK